MGAIKVRLGVSEVFFRLLSHSFIHCAEEFLELLFSNYLSVKQNPIFKEAV